MRAHLLAVLVTLAAACTDGPDAPPADDVPGDDVPGDDVPGDDPAGGTLPPELEALVAEINAERAKAGAGPVTVRDTLMCAAKRHSADIGPASECSHTGTDGSSPGSRVGDCGGGGWSGEIVACGHNSPAQAVQGWMNSDGHRTIMLKPGQKQIGVGMTDNFWTAIFDS